MFWNKLLKCDKIRTLYSRQPRNIGKPTIRFVTGDGTESYHIQEYSTQVHRLQTQGYWERRCKQQGTLRIPLKTMLVQDIVQHITTPSMPKQTIHQPFPLNKAITEKIFS
jgi:hypothetical protein